MSQYTYRAIWVQKLDCAGVREHAGEGRLIAAIDVAKDVQFMALMSEDRSVVRTVKWSHPDQTRHVVECLSALGAERIEAVMEPSGTYGDALRGCLRAAGIAVYRVSPKKVHDAAEVYDGVPSLHDAKAAYLIGRLHLEGVTRLWVEPDDQRRRLQVQLNRLADGRDRAQRLSSRLEALLARHWPEGPRLMDPQSVSWLQLLAEYGDPAGVAADRDAAAALLRRVGGHRLEAAKIEALLDSAANTVGVRCVDTEAEWLREVAAERLELRRRCRALERALAREVPPDGGLKAQAGAVGTVTAVVLRCALGDVEDYPTAASYAKAAGLNLKERSSGKHRGQLKLTKRGPGVVRFYVYFAVLRLIAQNGPAQAWYRAKVARDGGITGRAIGALMRKLIRALWHVGHGEEFDEAKLFEAARYERAA